MTDKNKFKQLLNYFKGNFGTEKKERKFRDKEFEKAVLIERLKDNYVNYKDEV